MAALKVNLHDVLHGGRSMGMALGISVLVFLLIELIIFGVFASNSGERSRIEVRDKTGKVIYDVAGTTLSQINFSYFERKYGDLANYDVEVRTIDRPFPVRAWVSASVGVPIVLILLVSYLVKVYLTLLQGGEQPGAEKYPVVQGKAHPLLSWSLFLTRASIFLTGAVIAGMALLFWMVPSFLGELAVVSLSAIKESSWLLQSVAVFLAGFLLWVVYLRYRLSRRMMDYHFRLEQRRLERQPLHSGELSPDPSENALRSREDV
ncbi:MAG: hypothetical protein MUF52_03505 [Syntrophobacteraceae bacterium]|jgi:hypothetical protein|nr:hypothetical protein [Syntrophobacteraceae bacterium]